MDSLGREEEGRHTVMHNLNEFPLNLAQAIKINRRIAVTFRATLAHIFL